MIVCRGLTKIFDGQAVLDGFSHIFKDNGFYLLFGESGSGKTTFLNILSGFLPFEKGRVEWNKTIFDRQIDYDCIEAETDYITQDTFFVDFLSVMDNMRLVSENDEQIRKLLCRVGLEGKEKQLPPTLSGGEKQRLAIARSLIGGKRLLLLDEPTASLDEENKRLIFELLSELKKDILIICSSHDAQAKDYADEVIRFTKAKDYADEVICSAKVREDNDSLGTAQADISPDNGRCLETENAGAGKRSSSGKNRNFEHGAVKKKSRLNYFLKKWFKREKHSRKSSVLFAVFVVLSSFLCLLADTPEHKLDSSMENLYKINFFTVVTQNKTRWEAVAPDGGNGAVSEAVLCYGRSCPSGDENFSEDVLLRPPPEYEMSLNVLPFERENFKLSDCIRYGSYFTAPNQAILSMEMAESFGISPESLIGEYITENIYGMGIVKLEIVGILDRFNDFEKMYMSALDIKIASGEDYNPDNYVNLFFVNSRLMESLEEDENFYANGTQRAYDIYFDSYSEMKNYFDRYEEQLNGNKSVQATYSGSNIGVRSVVIMLFYIFLPVAAFMAFFATLFYVVLKKTELMYNSGFIAVFEYSGYSKKRVINSFIWLNILELVKILLVSEALAFAVTVGINFLNSKFIWVEFQIFTYNIPLIVMFNMLIILVSLIAFNIFFRRIKVRSWYENMIAVRDLI